MTITKDKPDTGEEIRVTRNIKAKRLEVREEPIDLPESGVLYLFDVQSWENKMGFYDKILYSFGVPSTQKQVFCNFFNVKVMHYERTCQGVYYCPHMSSTTNNNNNNSSPSEQRCTVKPCRFRFHTCEIHKVTLKKSGTCKFKLHFYIPLDQNDTRRLLLCLGEHNHALLEPAPTSDSRDNARSSSEEDDDNNSSRAPTHTQNNEIDLEQEAAGSIGTLYDKQGTAAMMPLATLPPVTDLLRPSPNEPPGPESPKRKRRPSELSSVDTPATTPAPPMIQSQLQVQLRVQHAPHVSSLSTTTTATTVSSYYTDKALGEHISNTVTSRIGNPKKRARISGPELNLFRHATLHAVTDSNNNNHYRRASTRVGGGGFYGDTRAGDNHTASKRAALELPTSITAINADSDSSNSPPSTTFKMYESNNQANDYDHWNFDINLTSMQQAAPPYHSSFQFMHSNNLQAPAHMYASRNRFNSPNNSSGSSSTSSYILDYGGSRSNASRPMSNNMYHFQYNLSIPRPVVPERWGPKYYKDGLYDDYYLDPVGINFHGMKLIAGEPVPPTPLPDSSASFDNPRLTSLDDNDNSPEVASGHFGGAAVPRRGPTTPDQEIFVHLQHHVAGGGDGGGGAVSNLNNNTLMAHHTRSPLPPSSTLIAPSLYETPEHNAPYLSRQQPRNHASPSNSDLAGVTSVASSSRSSISNGCGNNNNNNNDYDDLNNQKLPPISTLLQLSSLQHPQQQQQQQQHRTRSNNLRHNDECHNGQQ